MPDLLSSNRDALPDHLSSAGDVVAFDFTIRAMLRAGGCLELVIAIHASGALSVRGCIGDRPTANALLANARDILRGYHQREGGIVVPGHDVSICGHDVREILIRGPVEDRRYAVACIDAAIAALVPRGVGRIE